MRYFLFAMLAVCTLAAAAAEGSGEKGSSERGRGRGRGMFGMGRRGGNFMEQMKNKYPKEYAEIEKLRDSDPEKARDKMRELMRKSMSESGMMPPGRGFAPPPAAEPTEEQLKELKAKYPEDIAEYEKLKKSDPEKAKEKLQQLMQKAFGENGAANDKFLRDRNRRANAFVINELKRRYPEKMQEIEKLQATDPDAAREELRKLFAESNLRMPGGQRELNYEYVPPQQQNNRNWMMNRGGFPFGGGGMMGPWGGRR